MGISYKNEMALWHYGLKECGLSITFSLFFFKKNFASYNGASNDNRFY